ncbi:hypothetical protein TWF718_009338 [Orbilia javanica]|uniref:Uncharacterized protein n=1 Tax=Orbilia javanica TaxID=47235 RepID=A0AAN8RH09_9PEZI
MVLISSVLDKLAELKRLVDQERAERTILQQRTNQLETHLALSMALESYLDDSVSIRRNRNARLETSSIQPVTRARSTDGAVVYEKPAYFPATVREFLRMDGAR